MGLLQILSLPLQAQAGVLASVVVTVAKEGEKHDGKMGDSGFKFWPLYLAGELCNLSKFQFPLL